MTGGVSAPQTPNPCTSRSTQLRKPGITEQFGKLVDRARLPQIRLHDVRHTYGTMALRAEINPKIVSTRLGHATVAFTLDTYTADVPDLDRAAAEQITGLFLPRPPSEVKLPELPR